MSLQVYPVLCRQGIMDNLSYILVDSDTQVCAVLDPSELAPVLAELQKHNLRPAYILNTHHHFDHVEGNKELKSIYGAKIVGPKLPQKQIEQIDIELSDEDIFCLGNSKAKILEVCGHTKHDLLWLFEQDKLLFTGDVLFNFGIGALFEGTAKDMFNTLQRIKKLPNDVSFFAGHEYTAHGFGYARQTCFNQEALAQYEQIAISRLQRQGYVCPIELGLEKQCNPYLQASSFENFCSLF